jgi:hypothetical protein
MASLFLYRTFSSFKIFIMEKIQILAIGRDPVVLQKLLRFINENPKWEGIGTVSDETAIEVFPVFSVATP